MADTASQPTTMTLTPTERRIWDRLADGERHSVAELMLCLNDEMAEPNNVKVHIFRMRQKLPPGHLIIGESNGRRGIFFYRYTYHVRYATGPNGSGKSLG